MVTHASSRWRFEVRCPHVHQVYLVMQTGDGRSQTFAMQRGDHNDVWISEQHLPQGAYDFHYFISDGQSLHDQGSHGLRMQPVRQFT